MLVDEKPLIDLTDLPKIEREFESSEEAVRCSEEVENVLRDLKVIRDAAAQLDSVVDTLWKKAKNQPNWRQAFYTTDSAVTEESDLLEDANYILRSVDQLTARYQQFFKDCEAAAHDLAQEERDNRRYGSYEEQVRSEYYGSR